MGFSTCCHFSISNISGCSFCCAFKAHLLSTGWISISCHCCFTKQWMWFSTCCHYPLSKSSGFGFPHIVTALSQKAVDGFPSCHCSELSSGWGFPHVVTALFQNISGCSFSCVFKAHLVNSG